MPNPFTQFGNAVSRAQKDFDRSLNSAFGTGDGRTDAQKTADHNAHVIAQQQQNANAFSSPTYIQPAQAVYVQPVQAQQVYVAQPIQPRVVGNHNAQSADAKAHAIHQAQLQAQAQQRASAQMAAQMQQQPVYVQGQPQPVYVQQVAQAPISQGLGGPPQGQVPPRKNVFQQLGDDLTAAQHNFDRSINDALGTGPSYNATASDNRAHQIAQQQAQQQALLNGQPQQQVVYVQQQQGYVQGAPQPGFYQEAPPAYPGPGAPQQAQYAQPQSQPQLYPVVKPQ